MAQMWLALASLMISVLPAVTHICLSGVPSVLNMHNILLNSEHNMMQIKQPVYMCCNSELSEETLQNH